MTNLVVVGASIVLVVFVVSQTSRLYHLWKCRNVAPFKAETMAAFSANFFINCFLLFAAIAMVLKAPYDGAEVIPVLNTKSFPSTDWLWHRTTPYGFLIAGIGMCITWTAFDFTKSFARRELRYRNGVLYLVWLASYMCPSWLLIFGAELSPATLIAGAAIGSPLLALEIVWANRVLRRRMIDCLVDGEPNWRTWSGIGGAVLLLFVVIMLQYVSHSLASTLVIACAFAVSVGALVALMQVILRERELGQPIHIVLQPPRRMLRLY